MFGAFRPTSSLSGGLLWKIPWRLSPHQKLRQRRRLRKVDDIVNVLDVALRREALIAPSSSAAENDSQQLPSAQKSGTLAQPVDLSSAKPSEDAPRADLESRRHGRGPHQGEMLPTRDAHGVLEPSAKTALSAVAQESATLKKIIAWKATMPTEGEMLPRDKYTLFDKKVRGFRKGVHKLPKWTRVSQRLNPPGF